MFRRHRRPWLVVTVAAILALTLVGAGCGDDDDDSGGSDTAADTSGGGGELSRSASCRTARAPSGRSTRPDIGGAQVPLVNRGAKAKTPRSRVTESTARTSPARTIEIVGYGCADDTADKAIEETRRLMEQDGAEILVGPLSGDEGIAVANYAKEHPESDVRQRHLGRPGHDAQGAGAELLPVPHGRRTVVGRSRRLRVQQARLEDGGDHRRRLLVPVHVARWIRGRVLRDRRRRHASACGRRSGRRTTPPSSPRFRMTWTACTWASAARALIRSSSSTSRQTGKIDRKKFMGNVFLDDPLVLKEIGAAASWAPSPRARRPATPRSRRPRRTWRRYEAVYPDMLGIASSVFAYNYYNAHGAHDRRPGGRQRRHLGRADGAPEGARRTSSSTAAYGQIKLDENRNAITDNYVQQIVKTDNGKPDVKTCCRSLPSTRRSAACSAADTPRRIARTRSVRRWTRRPLGGQGGDGRLSAGG